MSTVEDANNWTILMMRMESNMMYCEKCKLLFASSHCPNCHDRTERTPKSNDLCFLTEQQQPWSDILKDVLEQNGIPSFTRNVLGAGMAMKTGAMIERIKFYIPFSHFEEAEQLVEELFSGAGNQEI